MASSIGGVPCLIREVLFAPPCPPAVALLFEVALTQHNARCYEAALNTYMRALKEWEGTARREHFPELEMAENVSFMQRARREGASHGFRHGRPRLAGSYASGGHGEGGTAHRSDGSDSGDSGDDRSGGVGGSSDDDGRSDGGRSARGCDAPDASDAERAERERQRDEDERRHREQIAAVHQAHDLLPIEGRVFVRLAVGSVFESAADDERALVEYVEALRLVQSVPVFYTNLLAGTVYSCLGSAYFHLSQHDLAADYFFRALELREQLLGPRHVDSVLCLNNVACTLHMLGRSPDALALLYRTEAVLAAQLDASHPRLELVRQNIRRSRGVFLETASFPPVPFVPVTLPVIPGAERSKQFFLPKAKKGKTDDKKKKK